MVVTGTTSWAGLGFQAETPAVEADQTSPTQNFKTTSAEKGLKKTTLFLLSVYLFMSFSVYRHKQEPNFHTLGAQGSAKSPFQAFKDHL